LTNINVINTKVNKPYITKKLKHDTVSKVLESHENVVYRLYILANKCKEVQHFAEMSHPGISFSATLKTHYAFAGEARTQIQDIGVFSNLLKKKPKYAIKCDCIDLYNNKNIFVYRHEVSTSVQVYNSIKQCLEELVTKLNEKSIALE
jgi:hypothetical protein